MPYMEMMLLMLQAFADISSIYVQKMIQDQALATFCHGVSYLPESSQ